MKLDLLSHDSEETFTLNEQGVMNFMTAMQEQHNTLRQMVSLMAAVMVLIFSLLNTNRKNKHLIH